MTDNFGSIMKPFIALLALRTLVGLACNRAAQGTPSSETPAPPPAVPGEYQSLADELNNELGSFEGKLSQQIDPGPSKVIIATELSFANGNIGEGLLSPNIMDLNRTLLDRLQAIGVKGVVMQISYPLLDPSFPRSAEYLQFYKNIVREVHQRGLKVLVESGAIFAGTDYSTVKVDWSKYTTDTFLKGREDQVLLIANQVKPDYLMIGNEPTTEAMLTHLTITPQAWGLFLADTLSKIDRSGVALVGTGVGTWEDPAYFDQAMRVSGSDFIDIHIYPMGPGAVLLDRALTYAQQARAAGKRVTISESWLYKAAPQINNGYTNFADVYNRDVYGFWEPYDLRFITDLLKLADITHTDFVSFFWIRYFFSYLDYQPTDHNQSTAAFNRQINQASGANIQSGSYSALEQQFMQLLMSRAGK
jgi:hypothetical protein